MSTLEKTVLDKFKSLLLKQVSLYKFFNHQQQVVTGLVVNKVLSPTLSFLKETKTLIRRCRIEGPVLIADEHGFTIEELRQVLSGRIAFIRSVNPKKGRDLRGLLVGISWKESEI